MTNDTKLCACGKPAVLTLGFRIDKELLEKPCCAPHALMKIADIGRDITVARAQGKITEENDPGKCDTCNKPACIIIDDAVFCEACARDLHANLDTPPRPPADAADDDDDKPRGAVRSLRDRFTDALMKAHNENPNFTPIHPLRGEQASIIVEAVMAELKKLSATGSLRKIGREICDSKQS